MAVKKTQMYRRNLDGTETNLNPLTESQYVLMENGQTVQEVLSDRDSDKYTPVITNSSSTFKVGQGDNVDLSSSMKEGAYDSCVLKGKTMVNCIQEPSSKDVVLPYEFEDGQYVTINDTKESGALGVELKGQTLVNLVPSSVVVSGGRKLHKDDGSGQIVYTYKPKVPLKPNTVYTCFVWLKDVVNPNSVPLNCSMSNRDFYARPMTNGLNIAVGTTKSELGGENCNIRIANADVIAGARGVLLDAVVVEGDYSSIEINPFYGMASCKMPILSTVGKNLFDGGIKNGSNLHINTGIEESGTRTIPLNFTKVKPNTTYTFSRPLALGAIGLRFYDKDKNYIKHGSTSATTSITFTTPNQCYYIKWVDEANKTTEGYQIEEGSTGTTYEPHKTSILSLPEEVVLRSLPNGVCDTFNTRTGVYTQRVGAMVLNGSDPITSRVKQVDNVLTTTSRCYLDYASIPSDISMKPFSSANRVSDKLICDILPVKAVVPDMQQDDIESVGQTTAGFSIRVRGKSITECKQRLAERPVTILYERQVPIVTKINLSSTLKSWNTTTHIHSEIPENTLYPILSHSNPSYPAILKPSTKYSIVASSYSNGHTNSAINFNLGGATATTTVGNRVTTVTTPSTLSNELLTMSGKGNKLNNVMVIEGDVVGDESYFEGICDCKSPILSNIGETILETPFEKEFGTDAQKEFFRIVDCAEIFDNFGVGKQYTLSLDIKANKSGAARIYLQNGSGSRHNFSFDIPVTTEYVRHTKQITPTMAGDGHNFKESWLACFTTYNTGCFATIKNIRISTGEDEPYKSNILSCETYFDETTQSDKTIVLRSLPNGVCDTLNVETGEYVQRIGQNTFDGSENWTLMRDNENENILFSCTGFNSYINVSGAPSMLCDKIIPKAPWTYTYSQTSSNGIVLMDTRKGCRIGLIRSEGVTNVDEFKTWLAKNPTTIQYELETPIVSTIDVQGFPYAYTNGHVQLSSGHSGQSLTPKVEYSLSANKTGQINSNTKRASTHQKQLDDFEAMMLTAMVQSAYDKAILQFDYEMQMMSLGGE